MLLRFLEVFKCLLLALLLLVGDINEVILVGLHVSFVCLGDVDKAAVFNHPVEVLGSHLL